jgi:oligoendopeptidase F
MSYPIVDPLDWNTVQPHVEQLLDADLQPESVQRWLQQWSDLSAVIYEANAQIQREITENTADAEAEQRFLTFVEKILPQVRVADQALRDKLLRVEGYVPSAETREMVRRFRAEASIYRDENVPLLSELMVLENEYGKITGALTIDWDGETETLPKARQRQHSLDRSERERAWRLEMVAYASVREELNNLYLKMLPLRRQLARNAGLADYRAYRWLEFCRFDYTPQDCQTFHDAIEQAFVPLANKITAELGAMLGLESVRPWDIEVDPYGEPLKPFEDVSELVAGARRIFEQVDPVLASHFAGMQEGFLDLASRPNKAPGGYCESFPVSGKPYIFMNAVGMHDDVSTLLHEGGHAFHFMESRRHSLLWNHGAPMEFSEVASMSMELLSAPYLEASKGGFYSARDAQRARASELRITTRFLPYMAVVDAFQHWVYVDAPEDVTPADLDATWSRLWDRFMPGLDFTGLQAVKETGWHRKLHIFQAPFYYVEYGLAQLGALQVWRNALRDQKQAVADYRAALATGNTRSLSELFQIAGASFAFDRGTVGELAALIEAQLAPSAETPG